MKLNVTTTHEIKFKVEYFRQTEGGMEHEYFGDEMETIQEAIECLAIAKKHSKDDWIITVDVKTTVK